MVNLGQILLSGIFLTLLVQWLFFDRGNDSETYPTTSWGRLKTVFHIFLLLPVGWIWAETVFGVGLQYNWPVLVLVHVFVAVPLLGHYTNRDRAALSSMEVPITRQNYLLTHILNSATAGLYAFRYVYRRHKLTGKHPGHNVLYSYGRVLGSLRSASGIREVLSGGTNPDPSTARSEASDGSRTDQSSARSGRQARQTQHGGSTTTAGQTAPNRPTPETGTTVTYPDQFSVAYEDIDKGDTLGSGGNADVYRAAIDGAELPVALKEPRMSGTLHTDTIEAILAEAETWEKLDDHDHIVDIVDYDSQPLPWIAMEYMDGGPLDDRAGDLDTAQALWTAIEVTKAVRHAHRRGVAHLDLKPENVLFRSVDGAWDVPKVADWGLSKHLLEHSKSVEGLSPHYAAPEQFDDDYGPPDDITDVYQLGAVFYELFTGQPPFEGQPAKVMNKVLNEEPTPPSEIADVPPELDDVLLNAMAKDKADRYEDVLLLRNELQELYEEPS
jgi:hypothetical protein